MRDEWLARLPDEKGIVFGSSVATLETRYRMLSVILNEALQFQDEGNLSCARREASFCGQLFDQLAGLLSQVLDVFESHSRHFGTIPVVASLDPGFFQGEVPKRVATWDAVMHHVLLGTRSCWFHKLRALREIIWGLSREFLANTEEISGGTSLDPTRNWEALEGLHFDLNTCLRELIVMLKCFLLAMPGEQVPKFRGTLDFQWAEVAEARAASLTRADR